MEHQKLVWNRKNLYGTSFVRIADVILSLEIISGAKNLSTTLKKIAKTTEVDWLRNFASLLRNFAWLLRNFAAHLHLLLFNHFNHFKKDKD
jgi:hypothetical protein